MRVCAVVEDWLQRVVAIGLGLVSVHASVIGTEISLCDQQKSRVVDAAEIQLAYMRLLLALRSASVINKSGVVVDAAEIQLVYTRLLLALRSASVINKRVVLLMRLKSSWRTCGCYWH